jgi:hypothetical protein
VNAVSQAATRNSGYSVILAVFHAKKSCRLSYFNKRFGV